MSQELREDLEEALRFYHKQNQALRAVLGFVVTAIITFVPPSNTLLDTIARAATPAAGTVGWVLYRGKRPVISMQEVHDVVDYWEQRQIARAARRAARVRTNVAPVTLTPPAPPAGSETTAATPPAEPAPEAPTRPPTPPEP